MHKFAFLMGCVRRCTPPFYMSTLSRRRFVSSFAAFGAFQRAAHMDVACNPAAFRTALALHVIASVYGSVGVAMLFLIKHRRKKAAASFALTAVCVSAGVLIVAAAATAGSCPTLVQYATAIDLGAVDNSTLQCVMPAATLPKWCVGNDAATACNVSTAVCPDLGAKLARLRSAVPNYAYVPWYGAFICFICVLCVGSLSVVGVFVVGFPLKPMWRCRRTNGHVKLTARAT